MKISSLLLMRTILVLSAGCALSSAQSVLPQAPSAEISRHLVLLGFKIGKNTLADVQAKLGESKAKRCSHDEEARREICYVSSGTDHTKVVFTAGFSGGWTDLDGYKIISTKSNLRCYRQCARASLSDESIQTESGLRIGLTRKEVVQLIGKPIHSSPTKLIFRWNSRQSMTKAEIEKQSKTFSTPVEVPYWDVLDSMEISLANDKVIEIEARHVVSY